MARYHSSARPPRTSVLLFLSAILDVRSLALMLPPQETKTIQHHALDVVSFPPAPTSPPIDLRDLLQRQDTNTICGYIGGNSGLAATCSAGSHCVLDQANKVVGCCPNGQATCTTGVFTGCVDYNSPAQTVLDPYIFTCQGRSQCYSNQFEGGYSQYGCGASTMGTSVAFSPTGVASAVPTISSSNIGLTATPTSLATPTTIGSGSRDPTASRSSSASSTSAASSTGSSGSQTPSSTSSSSSSSTSGPAAAAAATSASALPTHIESTNTGAIIGGTIAGIVVLALLLALLAFCCARRRRRRNTRRGPGPRTNNTQYVSPMSGANGQGFAPVHQSNQAYEEGMPGAAAGAPMRNNNYAHNNYPPERNGYNAANGGNTDNNGAGIHPALRNHNGYGTTALAVGGAGAAGAGAHAAHHNETGTFHHNNADNEMLLEHGHPSPELDDFSRGYSDALSRIGEEDEEDLGEANGHHGKMNGNGHVMNGNGYANGHARGGSGDLGEGNIVENKPLWLQPRRQSRNMMWT